MNFNEEDLKEKIKNLIQPHVYGDIDDYFNDQNMPIWISFVTHETVDPKRNYIFHRYFGGYILDTNISLYATMAYRELNEGNYSDLLRNYISESQYRKMTIQCGFDKFIRINEKIIQNTDQIIPDLYPSFFGALYEVAENIQKGIGNSLCFNVIVKIYSEIQMNFSKPATTKFIQFFQRYKLTDNSPKLEDYIVQNEDGSFDIILPSSIDSQKFGDTHFGTYMDVEIEDAFREALKILDKRGISVPDEYNDKSSAMKVETIKWSEETITTWKSDVRKVTSDFLKDVVPPKILKESFFNRGNMMKWSNSLTDPSYDSQNNYNIYEFVGDRILNLLFLLHCKKMNLTIDGRPLQKKDYSILLHYYQGKEHQSLLAQQNKIHTIIRIDAQIIESMEQEAQRTMKGKSKLNKLYSDILESFIGALFHVGNSVLNGLGMIFCDNFVAKYYPIIDPQKARPSSTTVFTQLFQRFSLPESKSNYYSLKDGKIVIISLPKEVVQFLIKYGTPASKEKIIGVDANGRYILLQKETTQEKAFAEGLNILNQIGINQEWAVQLKRKFELDTIEDKKLIQNTEFLMEKLGFKDLRFERPQLNGTDYILYAKNSEKDDILLSVTKYEGSRGSVDIRKVIYPLLLQKFIDTWS